MSKTIFSRECLKKDAVISLWDRGWTKEEISLAVSKSLKWVGNVLFPEKQKIKEH